MAINRYSKGIDNTLEEYIPLPLDMIAKAGAAIQQRGDMAEALNEQTQFGLASAEALASGHKEFINQYANEYKAKAGELLSKYGNNTSNPEFIRESKRLNTQFASDPRLQIVKQSNEQIRQAQKIGAQLQARGMKYLDPLKGFTGRDEKGNLLMAQGSPQAVLYDQQIDKALSEAASKMEQRGSIKSNEWNLATGAKGLKSQILTDPDLRTGVQYLMQQGYSQDQAIKSISTEIDQKAARLKASDLDHFYEQEANSERRHRESLAAQAKAGQYTNPPHLPFELLSYSKPITPNTNKEVGKSESLSKVESLISDLDSKGNLVKTPRYIPATPENMKLYPNLKPVYKSYPGDRGVDTTPKHLRIEGYNPEEVKFLNTARSMMGVKGGSAKEIFSRFSKVMSDFEQSSNKIMSTDNVKINKATADVARRQVASGEVYTVEKGNLKKVNLEDLEEDQVKDISNLKEDNIIGISNKNLGALSGYTQFTDSKGKNYYTPIPEEYQRKFRGSKVIENYLQDFDPKNLKSQNINFIDNNNKTKSMKIYINPNQPALPYPYKGVQGEIIPYKHMENGKLVAGAIFQTDQGYTVLPMSAIESNEFQSLFGNVGNNNKVTGNE